MMSFVATLERTPKNGSEKVVRKGITLIYLNFSCLIKKFLTVNKFLRI